MMETVRKSAMLLLLCLAILPITALRRQYEYYCYVLICPNFSGFLLRSMYFGFHLEYGII